MNILMYRSIRYGASIWNMVMDGVVWNSAGVVYCLINHFQPIANRKRKALCSFCGENLQKDRLYGYYW